MNWFDLTKRRYLQGAILCAGLNNLILIGGDAMGFSFTTLSFACFFMTGGLAYVIHSLYTFRQPLCFGGYLIFIASQLAGLLMTLLCLHLLYRIFGLPMWLAAPIVTVIMLLFNYMGTKIAVLRRLRH